jgi:uncharacterized protein YdhG (YjbR/CyaY superfamily)
MKAYSTVKEYIASFPPEIQVILNKLHKIVRDSAPTAQEYIGYGMPGYKLNGKPLIYFAAFKNHLGLYPTPSGVAAFTTELVKYKKAKGSIQFPLKEPIPYDLIGKIIDYRVNENLGNLTIK